MFGVYTCRPSFSVEKSSGKEQGTLYILRKILAADCLLEFGTCLLNVCRGLYVELLLSLNL